MIAKRENLPTADAGLSYARDEDWRDDAACRDLPFEAFFPEGQGEAIPSAIKRVCGGCPSRQKCLDFALTHRIRDGIWGGVGERDRRGKQPGAVIPIRIDGKKAS